jgi:hypothetical protein
MSSLILKTSLDMSSPSIAETLAVSVLLGMEGVEKMKGKEILLVSERVMFE